ncbi:hypothetical protein [Alcanivorax sediminis]
MQFETRPFLNQNDADRQALLKLTDVYHNLLRQWVET